MAAAAIFVIKSWLVQKRSTVAESSVEVEMTRVGSHGMANPGSGSI